MKLVLMSQKKCWKFWFTVSEFVVGSGEQGTVVIRWLRPEFKFPAKIEITFSQLLAIRGTPIVSI